MRSSLPLPLTQVCAHSELVLGVVREECRGFYWLWLGLATVYYLAFFKPLTLTLTLTPTLTPTPSLTPSLTPTEPQPSPQLPLTQPLIPHQVYLAFALFPRPALFRPWCTRNP